VATRALAGGRVRSAAGRVGRGRAAAVRPARAFLEGVAMAAKRTLPARAPL